MADYEKPSSSILSSPRLLTAFASKGFNIDSESLMSPTSILDSKQISAFRIPFWSDQSASPRTPKPENKLHWEKLDSRGVGLGILDALTDEKSNLNFSNADSPRVLFGSQLKIQIPSLSPVNFCVDSPKSPADFGIKTRNSQMGNLNSQMGNFSPGLSPSFKNKSTFECKNSGLENTNSPVSLSTLSITEMELSEDYTCVISHGPNPKTTHIFDDCIVGSCCGVLGPSLTRNVEESFTNSSISYSSDNFLSFCYNCKKNLGQGEDIYIYRGDKAFCSNDCRYKQMILEEGVDGADYMAG